MTIEPTDQHPRPPNRPFSKKRLAISLGALLLVAAAGFAVYRHYSEADGASPKNAMTNRAAGQAQPVSVAEVAVRDMHVWLPAIGTATPRNLVTIHTRVDGELLRLHFNEGDMVKQGQLLAELDPRPYQAQLAQANGQLIRDQALLQNARVDLARYQELWANDSIARQILDTQTALVRQYEGTVENDRGLVDNAKLQVIYSRIVAPVSGRIGLRQVDPGNLVHAADSNGLASIAQIEPMTVLFAAPENRLADINRRLGDKEALLAEAWDREQKTRLAVGRLLTTDNQIDPTTGTIKLRAIFANTDHSLFPSQFINIRLLLGTLRNATVIPSSAVMRGTKGFFVYTVDNDGIVNSVEITSDAVDGEFTAISGGLKAGQRIVTDGGDRLRDGAKVEVISPEKPGTRAGGEPKEGRQGKTRPGKDAPTASAG